MTKLRHTIVLTGAPASGKTSTFEYLKTLPHLSKFVFFEELARRLLESDPNYRQNWHQLHLDIYRKQNERELAIGDSSFITDRGTIDAFAFHPETAQAVNTSINQEYARYKLVIQLGSSANLGENFYQIDPIRNESITKALKIENAIKSVWQDHPNYHHIKAEPELATKRNKVVEVINEYIDFK